MPLKEEHWKPIRSWCPIRAKSKTAYLIFLRENKSLSAERSTLSLWEKRFCQSKMKRNNLHTPKRRLKWSEKVFPMSWSPTNQVPLLRMRGMKFLFLLLLAVMWKNFVLESPSFSQVTLGHCFQWSSSCFINKERSNFSWEKCCASASERDLFSLIESKELSSRSIEFFCNLNDPTVSIAHFQSLAFKLINFLEITKAPHPSGEISLHQPYIWFTCLSLEYQDFSKWNNRGLKTWRPNSRQIGTWSKTNLGRANWHVLGKKVDQFW